MHLGLDKMDVDGVYTKKFFPRGDGLNEAKDKMMPVEKCNGQK